MKFLLKLAYPTPNVMSMLGVGTYTARKIVDAIFLGSTFWRILTLVIACGSSVVVGLMLVKRLTKILGRTAAINW